MSVLETTIGLLAPALCVGCAAEGSAICADCQKRIQPFGERCWRCNRLSPGCRTCASCLSTGSPAHVYIHTDYEALARQLVVTYKFGHQRTAAASISKLMVGIYLKHADVRKDLLVVPVPTATSRMRQRGFGHTELLAKHVAWQLRLERREALRRLGQTRQLGARREQRLAQLDGSFAVRRPSAVMGRRILLVDDVLTTGGTIIAAAKTLRAAGAASVAALLFAKRL